MNNTISRLFAVARYEFTWDIRKYRTIVMLFVILLATIGYGIIQPMLLLTPAERLALGNNWWMNVIGQHLFTEVVIGVLPLVVGGTLATDSISQEFDKGWIVPLMSQPVSKAEIYIGKVFEKIILCCIFSLVVITVSLVSSYVVDSPASYLNLVPYIFLSVVVTFFGFSAIALLLSSVIKNSSVVFGSLLGLLVLLIIVYFTVVFYSNSYTPWMNAVPMINESMFPSVIGQYLLNPNGNLPFAASSFGVTKTESISAFSFFSSSIISVLVEIGLVLSSGFYFFRRKGGSLNMNNNIILQLDGIKKVYRGGYGISGINMNIHSGGIHGFLGQNGAGKTTTMKCIMGLISYDSGSMRMFGEEYKPGNWKLKARIGFMPEILAFPPYLTALEVMLTYGRIRGVEKSALKSQAEVLLEKVGLMEVKNRKVGTFSKGMTSRLGIAFSMNGNPDILILDEPTSGLDPVSKTAILKLFKEIENEGKTVVLSSHQLQDVENLCGSVTVINRGLTVAEGPTEMLRKKDGATSYRAEFSKVDTRLLSGLRSLEGVASVNEIEGKNMVRVVVAGEKDIREMLAKEAVALGNAMLSCEEEKKTLEELFFQLIN